MTTASQVALEIQTKSNTKLLKALIVALALKDETLLDDLRAVFLAASERGNNIGKADPKVWKEISRRLTQIEELVAEDGHLLEGVRGPDEAQGGLH